MTRRLRLLLVVLLAEMATVGLWLWEDYRAVLVVGWLHLLWCCGLIVSAAAASPRGRAAALAALAATVGYGLFALHADYDKAAPRIATTALAGRLWGYRHPDAALSQLSLQEILRDNQLLADQEAAGGPIKRPPPLYGWHEFRLVTIALVGVWLGAAIGAIVWLAYRPASPSVVVQVPPRVLPDSPWRRWRPVIAATTGVTLGVVGAVFCLAYSYEFGHAVANVLVVAWLVGLAIASTSPSTERRAFAFAALAASWLYLTTEPCWTNRGWNVSSAPTVAALRWLVDWPVAAVWSAFYQPPLYVDLNLFTQQDAYTETGLGFLAISFGLLAGSLAWLGRRLHAAWLARPAAVASPDEPVVDGASSQTGPALAWRLAGAALGSLAIGSGCVSLLTPPLNFPGVVATSALLAWSFALAVAFGAGGRRVSSVAGAALAATSLAAPLSFSGLEHLRGRFNASDVPDAYLLRPIGALVNLIWESMRTATPLNANNLGAQIGPTYYPTWETFAPLAFSLAAIWLGATVGLVVWACYPVLNRPADEKQTNGPTQA